MTNPYRNVFYERDKTDEFIFQYAQDRLYREATKNIDVNNNSKKILDLGCGIGDLTKYVGKLDYYGNDISIPNIGYMSKKYKKMTNIKSILGNIKNLPYKNNVFDYVVCTEVIEHIAIKELLVVLKEIKRVSKNGAKVIITTPNLNYLWAHIPWSVCPFRKRMKIKDFIKGVKQGYVSEEYNLTHYRFKQSFLKKLLGDTFYIEKMKTTYWYNNRAIHSIFSKFQMLIHKLSWRGEMGLGSQLIFRCKVIK
jgi:ubiquinone/menaquinone biosynthesis C-methylase UbiE